MATETTIQSSDDDRFLSEWQIVGKSIYDNLNDEDSDEDSDDSIEVIEREVLRSITPISSDNEEEEDEEKEYEEEEEKKCQEMFENYPPPTEWTPNIDQNPEKDDLSNAQLPDMYAFNLLNNISQAMLFMVILVAIVNAFIHHCKDSYSNCILGNGTYYEEIINDAISYLGVGLYKDDNAGEQFESDTSQYSRNDYNKEDFKLPFESDTIELIKNNLREEKMAFDLMWEQYEKNLVFLNYHGNGLYTLNINAWESSVQIFKRPMLAALKEHILNELCPDEFLIPPTICNKNGVYLLYIEKIHVMNIFRCVSGSYKNAKRCSSDRNILDLIESILNNNDGTRGFEFSNKRTEELHLFVHDKEYALNDKIRYNKKTFEEQNYEVQFDENTKNGPLHQIRRKSMIESDTEPHTHLPENDEIPTSSKKEIIVQSEKDLKNNDALITLNNDIPTVDKIDTKATLLMKPDVKSNMEYDTFPSTGIITHKESNFPEALKNTFEEIRNKFPEDRENPSMNEKVEQSKDSQKENDSFDPINDELFVFVSEATASFSKNSGDDASNLEHNLEDSVDAQSVRVDPSQTFSRYHDTMIKIENLTTEIKSLIKEFKTDLKQFYKNQIVNGEKKKKRDLRQQRKFERAVIQQYLYSSSFDKEIDLLNFTSFNGTFPDHVHGFAYNTIPFTDRWSTKSKHHSYVFDLPGDWILKLGKAREKLRKVKAIEVDFEETKKSKKQKWKKHRDWIKKTRERVHDNYRKFSSEWKLKFKRLKEGLRHNYKKFLSSDWKSYVKNLFPRWHF